MLLSNGVTIDIVTDKTDYGTSIRYNIQIPSTICRDEDASHVMLVHLMGILATSQAEIARMMHPSKAGSVATRKTSTSNSTAMKRWTKEENTLLLKLYFDNVPVEKISMRLNRTPNAIYQQFSKLTRDRSGDESGTEE